MISSQFSQDYRLYWFENILWLINATWKSSLLSTESNFYFQIEHSQLKFTWVKGSSVCVHAARERHREGKKGGEWYLTGVQDSPEWDDTSSPTWHNHLPIAHTLTTGYLYKRKHTHTLSTSTLPFLANTTKNEPTFPCLLLQHIKWGCIALYCTKEHTIHYTIQMSSSHMWSIS